jgi:hypothetical protein
MGTIKIIENNAFSGIFLTTWGRNQNFSNVNFFPLSKLSSKTKENFEKIIFNFSSLSIFHCFPNRFTGKPVLKKISHFFSEVFAVFQ